MPLSRLTAVVFGFHFFLRATLDEVDVRDTRVERFVNVSVNFAKQSPFLCLKVAPWDVSKCFLLIISRSFVPC